MPENFVEKIEASKFLIKGRLEDLRRIFQDYEINLQEKTGVGQISFKEIKKQMQGVRGQYQKLLESLEIGDDEKDKYRVELEEMDEILSKANITEAAE